MGIPNLLDRSPVEMYGWVWGSTSGFTRSATGARAPSSWATRSSSASSAGGSTLNKRRAALRGSRPPSPGFPGAGVDDFLRLDSGLEGAEQLAAGEDFGAGSLARQGCDDGQIRIGLHGVGDQMRVAPKAGIVAAVILHERGARIDVRRGADGVGDGAEGSGLAVELPVSVFEVRHGGVAPAWFSVTVARASGEVKARWR